MLWYVDFYELFVLCVGSSGGWLPPRPQLPEPVFLDFMEPRNRFQEMNSASLCSLAGWYDSPIPTWFLAPKNCLKIPALLWCMGGGLEGNNYAVREEGGVWEAFGDKL